MSGGSKKVTVGYKYYLGIYMVLCHGPIDKITKVMVDNKDAWTGNATGGTITVDASDLFGGEKREGGISGKIDVMMGESTQVKNTYLQSMLGSSIPAFKGVVSAVLNQVYVGLNPYLKPWAFRAQRIHKTTGGAVQWYDAKAQIGNDMNPAHIIRECLTDSQWGLGYGPSDIDDTSFTAAADTLYTEGMGVSLLWDKSKEISDFLGLVLSHIQGSLYVSRTSGKFVLKLSRADYDVSSLIELDESSVSKIVNFKRASVGDLINSVTVIYWDASTGKENSVSAQDIALIAQQGCVISTTKQYPGFTTGANATRAASTELQALSTPLASVTIYANRKAANLNVGDVFKLSWPRYGVVQIILRVTSVELGTLDNNNVKIEAVEDVFSAATAVYAPPPVTNWTNPVTQPAPCTYQFIYDSPYWDIAQEFGDAQASALATTAGYVQAIGVRPSSDSVSASVYTKSSGSYEESNQLDFCPTARLTSTIGYLTTIIPVDSWIDRDIVSPGSYAIIDNEIVAVDATSEGDITVRRGCLDTVPATHAINARVYFADDFATSDGFEYAQGDIARFKLLPTTGKGTLAIGSATELTTTVVARQAKPYPPGNLKLNGQAYPTSVNDFLTVTWNHSDRLMQTVKPIIDTTAGSIGPEAGVTYELRLLKASDNSVLATASGLTGVNYTFSYTASGLDVKLELWSVRGGIASYQKYSHPFTLTVTPFNGLLLHFNGSNGSTTFTDSGAGALTISPNGNASISTVQSKFGGASGLFDGTGDYLSVPSTLNTALNGTFTMELFVYQTSYPNAYPCLISRATTWGSSNDYSLYANHASAANKYSFWLYAFSSTVPMLVSTSNVSLNTWTHIAVTKDDNVWRLFVNGVLEATVTNTLNITTNSAEPCIIGNGFCGYIDELRVRRGEAVYTATFTPPVAPF